MEHLLSKKFSERLKTIVKEHKDITYKGISKALGYKTDNSITNQLNGTTPPAWERTCDLVEYLNGFGVSNSALFDSNENNLKVQDTISFQRLQKQHNELNNEYENLKQSLKPYKNILNFCKELTPQQLDTFATLIAQPLFVDILHQIKIYSSRYYGEYKKSKDLYFFTPYHFYNQTKLDATIQQTIYTLRKKYIENKQNETRTEWSENRKKYLEESAIKYRKVDGRSSERDKFMKKYTENLNEEAFMYSIDYLTSHFPNLWDDLDLLNQDGIYTPEIKNKNSYDDYSFFNEDELNEAIYLDTKTERELEQQFREALEEDD